MAMNILLIEHASLELVPQRFLNRPEALEVKDRFGVAPSMQILDRNLHGKIFSELKGSCREKRGRPDVVHYALLEATSTPLFQEGGLRVIIHTITGLAIEVLEGTRPPRTLERFCGVMSKLISGRFGEAEKRLFQVNKTKSFEELIGRLEVTKVITFTARGTPVRLANFVCKTIGNGREEGSNIAWVVGGFPAGDFEDEVIGSSNKVVSISPRELTAHVVVARLCYELEGSLTKG